MAIITKFSDYVLHSIEYFITQIENELEYRDLPGLSNNHIEKINITKEHPLVSLIAASLNDIKNADNLRSSLLPAISVTPGNMNDEGFTLGQSFKAELIDDNFIDDLKELLNLSLRQRSNDVLITDKQIDLILGAYKQNDTGGVRLQKNEWHKNEEINISVWTPSPDLDILLGNLMDSIISSFAIGFVGDNSNVRKFQYKTVKGLTNFNFGKVLFGTEYNLTFLNTFNNYIIYTDPVLSGHDFTGTFEISGE